MQVVWLDTSAQRRKEMSGLWQTRVKIERSNHDLKQTKRKSLGNRSNSREKPNKLIDAVGPNSDQWTTPRPDWRALR